MSDAAQGAGTTATAGGSGEASTGAAANADTSASTSSASTSTATATEQPSASAGSAGAPPPAAGSSAGAPPGQTPTDQQTQQAVAEMFDLVIDGKSVKKTLDDLKRDAQRVGAADRRFEEAATLRKKVADIGKKLGSDAIVRAYLSGDKQAFFLAVADHLEYENAPPEERKKRDEQRHLRERAARADELEQRDREQSARAEEEQHVARFRKDATAALTAAGVDVDGYSIERWAGEMIAGKERTGRWPDPAEAAKRVAARLGEVSAKTLARIAGLEGPALLAELDKLGITQKVRAADAQRLEATRAAASTTKRTTTNTPSTPRDKPKRDVSTGRYIRALQRGEDIDALFNGED